MLKRVTIKGITEGVAFQNVIYLDGPMTAQEAATEVRDHFVQQMLPYLSSVTTFNEIDAIEVAHSLTDPDYYSLAVSLAGAAGSDHSDPQLAACFRLHTGLSGRSRRGRFFFCGTHDTWVEGGKLTSAGQSGLESITGAWVTRYTGSSPTSGEKLQVFSRKYFSLLSNPLETSHKDVTSISVNPVMSTMRSRKP